MESIYIILLTFFIFLHYIYTTSTLRTVSFTVKSKYVLYEKFSKLMVSSTEGEVFEVNNNVWLWKWRSVELWDKLKEGNTYKFKIYGHRYLIIDFFPSVVEIL
jgi:hypothetical protein